MILKYVKITICSVISVDIGFYPRQRRYIMARKRLKKIAKKAIKSAIKSKIRKKNKEDKKKRRK